MRQIKFRWWNPDKKQMLYWDVFESFESSAYYNILNECNDYMQFTWLTDKNGKELWEWDIISSLDGIFEIEYSEDWFYAVNWDEYSSLCSYTWQMNYPYDIDDVIVLWNIWENPDLIPKI